MWDVQAWVGGWVLDGGDAWVRMGNKLLGN